MRNNCLDIIIVKIKKELFKNCRDKAGVYMKQNFIRKTAMTRDFGGMNNFVILRKMFNIISTQRYSC